jgi:hypothetical protein
VTAADPGQRGGGMPAVADLEQHAEPRTKLLHAVGTSTVVLLLLAEPRMIAAGSWAGVVGLCAFRLCIGLSHGFVEFGAAIIAMLVLTRALTGSVRPALVALVGGYSFAWVAHRFVELNRPATFTYPIFSLLGDFRMCAEVLAGTHAVL